RRDDELAPGAPPDRADRADRRAGAPPPRRARRRPDPRRPRARGVGGGPHPGLALHPLPRPSRAPGRGRCGAPGRRDLRLGQAERGGGEPPPAPWRRARAPRRRRRRRHLGRARVRPHAVTLAAILLGLAIGLVLGSLGGGGSVLAVPVLVYLLDQDVHAATTASLVVVAAAALAGGAGQARGGQVCWPHAAVFAPAAVAGAAA